MEPEVIHVGEALGATRGQLQSLLRLYHPPENLPGGESQAQTLLSSAIPHLWLYNGSGFPAPRAGRSLPQELRVLREGNLPLQRALGWLRRRVGRGKGETSFRNGHSLPPPNQMGSRSEG